MSEARRDLFYPAFGAVGVVLVFLLGCAVGSTFHNAPARRARPAPPAVTRTCDQGYILWQTPTGGITAQPNPSICPTETRP